MHPLPPETDANDRLWLPTGHVITAQHRDTAGPAGTFVVVDCSVTPLQSQALGKQLYTALQATPTVAFWNPQYRVCIRLNELSQLDCSAECTRTNGTVYLPGGECVTKSDLILIGFACVVGWTWERFDVHCQSQVETNPAAPDVRKRRATSENMN